MKRILATVVLCAVAVGCGAGSTSFSGKVDGQSLSVKDSIFSEITGDDGNGGTQQVLVFFMADVTNLCELLTAGKQPPGSTSLGAGLFALNTSTGAASAPVTGTYDLGASAFLAQQSGLVGAMAFDKYDSSCTNTTDDSAASGTVTVSAFDAKAGGKLTGSFDAVFSNSSDHVTGTVDATYCALPSNISSNPSCGS